MSFVTERLSGVASVCRQLPFNLVPCHNVALLQGFDGVKAARLLVLRQQHLQGKEKLQIRILKFLLLQHSAYSNIVFTLKTFDD